MPKKKPAGWRGEPVRHGLSAKGIKNAPVKRPRALPPRMRWNAASVLIYMGASNIDKAQGGYGWTPGLKAMERRGLAYQSGYKFGRNEYTLTDKGKKLAKELAADYLYVGSKWVKGGQFWGRLKIKQVVPDSGQVIVDETTMKWERGEPKYTTRQTTFDIDHVLRYYRLESA